MNLVDILRIKFPNASLIWDIIIQDDGKGPYIKAWNIDAPKPTQEDLEAWAIEVQPLYVAEQNKLANAPIYEQLAEIDLKSIRALRADDKERLASLEAEAAILRGKLL